MKEITIFKSKEFGELRTVMIDDEVWFVGKDVAETLGYKKTRNAIAVHVSEDDKWDAPIQGPLGGTQYMKIINESGMYALVFGSRLESAKRFKHWVTSEVLPAIRKKGVYLTDQKAFDITHNPLDLADLLLQAGEQLKEKEIIIKEMKPKALFADSVANSHTSILVGELAKLLKQNGVEVGQNRLFKYLREEGYLIKRKGTDYNMPTQYSMDLKLFEIKETTIFTSSGTTKINKTPKVTGKGQIYFINKLSNHSFQ